MTEPNPRALKHLERAELEAQQAALILQALRESDPTAPMRREPETPGGDKRRLRGIPVVGGGGGGHLRGTHPLEELMRSEHRRGRRISS